MMWLKAGLLRDGEGLRSAADELTAMREHLPSTIERSAIELRNLHSVAERIVQSAIAREESRGAHFRNDFPARDDLHFQKHSDVRNGKLRFIDFTATSLDARTMP